MFWAKQRKILIFFHLKISFLQPWKIIVQCSSKTDKWTVRNLLAHIFCRHTMSEVKICFRFFFHYKIFNLQTKKSKLFSYQELLCRDWKVSLSSCGFLHMLHSISPHFLIRKKYFREINSSGPWIAIAFPSFESALFVYHSSVLKI